MKLTGMAWIVFSYVVALGAGAAVLWAPTGLEGYWALLAADLVATLVIFGFSIGFRNASFYDAYWSVIPPFLALWWLLAADSVGVRQVLVLALVCAWATRLTANWARGWTGLDHEDWRYGMLREQSGAAYPLVNLFGIHVFPTIQVFLACLPLGPALVWGTRPLGVLDVLAALVGFGAVTLNHFADEQLRAFRHAAKPGQVLDTGLWAWSRHPNYLGEMGFWWGLYLFALAADPTAWWSGIGALAISAMFIGISIPMIEKRMVEKRPAYAAVLERIPMIIPRPPRG